MNMIKNATILLTGADSPLGQALIEECLLRGARKIYAAGLSMGYLKAIAHRHEDMVIPLLLDLMNDDSILKISGACQDINMLINNAGAGLPSSFIRPDASLQALYEMKVNYIGVLDMINRLVPGLKRNHPSGIINIFAVGSGSNVIRLRTYCSVKAAGKIMTQAIREELKAENIQVFGVYPGYASTGSDNATFFEIVSYAEIACNICEGLESGSQDIFPDKISMERFSNIPASAN